VTLVLDENAIQQLPDSLFLGLNTLHILRLRNNDISDVYSNSFSGLVGLRELDLTGNRIPALPLGIFDPLGLLETLSLANNEIRHVEYMPFQSCRDLRTLDISNNLLPGISVDWFVPTTRLSVLKLAYNRIESIQTGSFDQLTQLEELDLRENYLSDLGSGLFARCRSLHKLDLTRNPLRQFPSPGTTFSGLTALRQLDLTGCCITELVLNSSAPLPALTELHLGNNLLTSISRHFLEAATSIQRLDLADNSIAAVEAGALSPLAHLSWLNLSRNLLTEDQLAASLRSLPSSVVVDASWNSVKSVASLTTPIAGIYLSGNPLVCSCASPSWISSADPSRFLDETETLCSAGNEPFYLLCYWSRCGPSTDDPLCFVPIPPTTVPNVDSLPAKTCRLDAALTVFGPRFDDFDAHALSSTSAQLSWNISDEFGTTAGFQFTFIIVDDCTNASAAVLSLTGNETSYTTTYNRDVNLTAIDIGNLNSGETYLTCGHVFQKPTGSNNRTSVSDTRCTCLLLPEETTTATRTPTTTTTTTTMTPSTTTTTQRTTTTTAATTTKTTRTTTTTVTTLTKRAIDFAIQTASNGTAISVSWVVANSSDQPAYFRLTCMDDDAGRAVMSADVVGLSYVIGNLRHASSYNVCVTAVPRLGGATVQTRCAVVETDDPAGGRTVPEDDSGVFLLIVVAVPIACLLLVLLLVCIAVVLCYRHRRPGRRHKPVEAEVTSSSSIDSSTGSAGQRLPAGNGAIPYTFSSPLSEQVVTSMNMYDEVVPSAPQLSTTAFSSPPATRYHPRSWTHASDPLPLQSSLSLNIYDHNFSY